MLSEMKSVRDDQHPVPAVFASDDDAPRRVWLRVDLADGEIAEHVVTTRAADDAAYDSLIAAAGGTVIDRFGDLTGRDRRSDDDFVVIMAARA